MAANRGLQAASFATLLSLSLSLSVSLNSRSYKSCVEQVVTPSSFRSGHNRDNDARGEGESASSRREGRNMAVLLLDSARVESRDRKRAKEEGMCVCVYVCVRVYRVSCCS